MPGRDLLKPTQPMNPAINKPIDSVQNDKGELEKTQT